MKIQFYKYLLRSPFLHNSPVSSIILLTPLLAWFLASYCTLTPLGTVCTHCPHLTFIRQSWSFRLVHILFSTNSLLSHHSLKNLITMFNIPYIYLLILISRLTFVIIYTYVGNWELLALVHFCFHIVCHLTLGWEVYEVLYLVYFCVPSAFKNPQGTVI